MADTLIRDNKDYGSVGEFLKDVVKEGSELSVVSAYFTIFAYYGLYEQLDSIKSMKFLFGEPTFVKSFDADSRNYKIEDDSIVISPNEKFSQKRTAAKLGMSRSAVLISTDKQASKLSDFELVTWLIIK